jgi:LCP family protein required for cell wall assembly
MIVIHIPAGGGQATVISIPRDSYVDIAGGYGKHKINSAYAYGKNTAATRLRAQRETGAQLETDSDQAGAKIAIQTVEQFTGLTINHYAAVNLVGFYYISQAVGGVPVCLNAPVHDSYSGANFPAGTQTISGAQALEFVRRRHGLPNGDLDRIKRQQAFMASMAKTVLSAGTLTDPTTLDNLIAAGKAVVIDSNWDILGFAQQLHGMSAGNIRFMTIPIVSITLRTPADGDAVEVDPQQVQAFVQNQIAGGTSSTPPSPTTPSSGNSGIVVDVRNTSGASGPAARVEGTLTAAGYSQGTVANAATRRSSIVYYPSAQRAEALQVAHTLGGLAAGQDSNLTTGHLRVYLGTDYSTGSVATPAASLVPAADPTQPITAGGITCVN